MADRTAIPWTDATWSPISGCSKVSAGCANCYISRTPPFRKAHRRFERVGNSMTTGVQLHPDRLDQPLHWRRPRRIFVCSMSDLFHEDVPDEFLQNIFAVMTVTPEHTYQILTKRPERMLAWMEPRKWMTKAISNGEQHTFGFMGRSVDLQWPLPNVWLGVSVENQYWADQRIPLLLQTPAAVRFLSMEPLLKRVDLAPFFEPTYACTMPTHVLAGKHGQRLAPIDWTIIGGESGPGHRPMDPAWIRDLADQCRAADVPVFIKQDSGAKPGQQGRLPDDLWSLKEFPSAAPG